MRNRAVFSDTPGKTVVIKHDIITDPGVKDKLKNDIIPETQRESVSKEI